MKTSWSRIAMVAVILGLALGLLPGDTSPVQAASNSVVISEFRVRGPNGGNDEFVELYNLSNSPVNIGGWKINGSNNAGTTSTRATITSNVTLNPGCHYLLTNSATSGGPYSGSVGSDQTYGTGITDDGGIALLNASNVPVDQVGMSNTSAYKEGIALSSLGSSNLNRGYERKPGGTSGSGTDSDDNFSDFQLIAPSDPQNLASACVGGDTAPSVASTFPVDGATGFAINANLTVTFSEPVNVTGEWFALACSTTGNVTAAVSGGPTTFTLDPVATLVDGESCMLTVLASQVSDQDANDPPDNMVTNFTVGFSPLDVCAQTYTPIPKIQGSEATVALTGSRTTQGVVVADYEGPSPALRGFFIQDPTGDANPATSDGIFVFEGSNADTVSLGDVVRVTGTAGENQGQSQISVGTIVKCGSGSVEPVDVTFPVSSVDYLEQFEGMLVRLPQTMYVTEHYQLGRFDEVLLSSGGRLQQPTNVALPGADAQTLQEANNLNQILIDDGSQVQNPDPILFARGGQPLSALNTLRGGDTATGIVGAMTYTWGGASASPNSYRVRPVNALGGYVQFEAANPRPTAPAVGGALHVVTMNTLNFFNTFTACTNGVGGAATDCRGAQNQVEFDRQWPKTVAAIVAANPDVLGLVELENDGYGPSSAIQFLVDELNAATAPGTFALVDVDNGTGQVNTLGTDAIKVGIVYKPAAVTPVGQTAVLNTGAFGDYLVYKLNSNGTINYQETETTGRNRPSLAQAFQVNTTGARFILDVNHLKSKGSGCENNISPVPADPDTGDGQGNCNLTRRTAAEELASWLATDPTGTGEQDVLIMGDLNAYAMEDPITVLQTAGYINLIRELNGQNAYSYVFDGQWGYLDHAIGSSSFKAQVAGVADFHINSDEPSVLDYNTNFKSAGQLGSLYAPDMYRFSDHDPVVVGLNPLNYTSSGFLRPLSQDDIRVFKGGNTIPVKIKFQALDGSYPADLAPTFQLLTETGEVVTSGVMRFTGAPDYQYIYNLGTKALNAGATYQIVVTVPSSGQTITVKFTLK